MLHICDMPRAGKKFSNQKKDATIKHLANMLRDDKLYNITSDPLGTYFEIKESIKQSKQPSEKQIRIKKEYSDHSTKLRKLSGTRRRTSPKIRTSKKGRTVNLKGVSY